MWRELHSKALRERDSRIDQDSGRWQATDWPFHTVVDVTFRQTRSENALTLEHEGGLRPMNGLQWLHAYTGHEEVHQRQIDRMA